MDFFSARKLSKGLFFSISALTIYSGSLFGISYPLPTPIGGPIQLDPSLTFPDPILANLVPVMDNHYRPPYYPGNFNSLTYLNGIYYCSNNYTVGGLVVHPFDDKIMHVAIGQNQVFDLKSVFVQTVGSNTFATSLDGGLSWSYDPPIEQIIPLGGTVSQIVNASVGPGLFYEYAKNGTLYGSGWGFFDMVANPPRLDPLSGFLFTRSLDSGDSWEPIETLWPVTGNGWFNRRSPFFNNAPPGTGTIFQEFYTTVDPSNSDLIHACSTLVIGSSLGSTSLTAFSNGNIYYYRSEDGGKTFSAPVLAYTIANDPEWLKDWIDPDQGGNLSYLKTGGTCLCYGHPVVADNDTVLIPLFFQQVRPGTTNRILNNTVLAGLGVVRSLDGGKTWSKCLGFSESRGTVTNGIFDPGFANLAKPVVINGFNCFGLFFDGPGLSRNPAGSCVFSPETGRIYQIYNQLRRFPPNEEHITYNGSRVLVVTVSDDKGTTWSPFAEVSRTPTNIPVGAQQIVTQGTAAVSKDGWFVVAYYDFRNWTGYPGEIYDNIDPLTAPPLPTDAWLAVYKETADPKGGSTGVGLDFVGEIRLTPESYDARAINLSTNPPYVSPFITCSPENIPLVFNNQNQLFVVYGTQFRGSSSNITTGYKGMTIDTNGYFNVYLQKYQFPKPGNQ